MKGDLRNLLFTGITRVKILEYYKGLGSEHQIYIFNPYYRHW